MHVSPSIVLLHYYGPSTISLWCTQRANCTSIYERRHPLHMARYTFILLFLDFWDQRHGTPTFSKNHKGSLDLIKFSFYEN